MTTWDAQDIENVIHSSPSYYEHCYTSNTFIPHGHGMTDLKSIPFAQESFSSSESPVRFLEAV